MLQLSFNGLDPGSELDRERIQREFRSGKCAFLPGFLHPSVLERVQAMARETNFRTREDCDETGKVFGREFTLDDRHPLANLMFFLLNQPVLFETVGALTETPKPMTYFRSRVYQMVANSDHFDSWHDDHERAQTIGLSVNLSSETLDGGEFEIRDVPSGKVLRVIENSSFGDAHIFQIGADYQHRVRPVRGTAIRFSCAGWFCHQPDYRTVLREMIVGRRSADHSGQ